VRARCVIGVSPVVNAISDLICRSVASAGFLGVFGFFDAPEPHATPVGHGHDLSAAMRFPSSVTGPRDSASFAREAEMRSFGLTAELWQTILLLRTWIFVSG